MRHRLLAAAAALLVAGCNPPKYVAYRSLHGDWTASIPWGWQIVTDSDGDGSGFAHANFLGSFDPDFYMGAPSLSVRWYKNFHPHRLPDGRLETYADGDDFIAQSLKSVYGPRYRLVGEPDFASESDVKEITLRSSGLLAKHFVVLSEAPAAPGARWGVMEDAETGRLVNVRQHAYVVIPMETGFYVLTYPATRAGFKKHLPAFNQLASGFLPVTRGPGGRRVRLPGPGRSGRAVDA